MRYALLLLTAGLLAGCNTYEPEVNTLLSDGKPLEVEGRDVGVGYVAIRLYPIENGEVAADPASDDMVEADGTFVILGRENKGVPPGKYRVEVLQYDPYPQDALKGKFSRENSPIEIEIGDDPQPLEIDLAEY